jgi:hypothetical protein
MYSNLSASMQAHLGTGVTSLYGLGHGSGNHAPTPDERTCGGIMTLC